MKKLIALLLAMAMCFALLTGCGSNNSAAEANDDSNASAAAENEEAAAAENTDAEAENTDNDAVLTMGTNAAFPPYEFYDGDTIVGIDAEIAAAIAEKLGLELQIVDMDFGSIITAVQTGKIDMGMAGMTVTEERLQNVNFSTTYATGIQVVIVPEDSDITSVDDIFAKLNAGEDVLIGCQEATTGAIYASGDFGDDHVTTYPNGATAVQALTQGKLDCVIIDNQPAINFVAANEGLKILDTEYVTEDYAIAISKDNEDLLNQINAALEELIADGTVQEILDKYIVAG
ncbi:MAG: ABC transporter substrate-binding protein [Candidatus Onthomonas sp.]|nr:ABC transporter substrate-binding protein [Candidatus Onthomonas sp.]